MTQDVYAEAGYGQQMIGFGNSPAIVVIDFMRTFTDSDHPLAGKPMVMRALENTAKLLNVARRSNVPVANCYTAYANKRAMPRFKITTVDDSFLEGHPNTHLDSRIHDPDYDVVVCKTKPSIFFHTPVVPFFTQENVDTVLVTGCCTSGCVRASIVDSFQYGFRTIVPEECVGDLEEGPHHDNLRDVDRRYADVVTLDETIAYLEEVRKRNR